MTAQYRVLTFNKGRIWSFRFLSCHSSISSPCGALIYPDLTYNNHSSIYVWKYEETRNFVFYPWPLKTLKNCSGELVNIPLILIYFMFVCLSVPASLLKDVLVYSRKANLLPQMSVCQVNGEIRFSRPLIKEMSDFLFVVDSPYLFCNYFVRCFLVEKLLSKY